MRLGYACMNMALTNPKRGSGRDRVTTSRTARKATWQAKGISYLGDLALLNAIDLLEYLEWNEEHDIKLFRVGSELFPWHDQYELHDLPQYNEIRDVLREAGDYARAHGHRLTTHPGPYHCLASAREDVVAKSLIGLERHSETWDLMGYEPSFENKINIHIGGAYGEPEVAAARWRKNWLRLSDRCRARLVVENDDKASLYSTQMLYDLIYSELGVPITFDYHHHKFHSSDLSEEQALKLASTTWPDDVRQCTHYSESRRDEYRRLLEAACAKHNIPLDELESWPSFNEIAISFNKTKVQAHSDYIIDRIDPYGLDIDIVVEAKAKEQAILRYRDIYNSNPTKELILEKEF